MEGRGVEGAQCYRKEEKEKVLSMVNECMEKEDSRSNTWGETKS